MGLIWHPHTFDMGFLIYGILPLVGWILYGAIWRLYLSPLAKFPGPKLAALTQWYEFYYNIIKPGVFFREIERMHEIYGMSFLSLTKIFASMSRVFLD